MLIHLIRHTTPDIKPGICYGQADLGLVDTFEQEKTVVHSKLLSRYDAVYTSPLQRCTLLADTIKSSNRFVDKRIMEYNFGDWELKPWEELKSPDTKEWMDNFVDQAAPNGDSILTMKKRVDDFFEELYKSDYQNVAVVSHSGVQRLIHARILETPLALLFRLQLNFGAVLEIQINNETKLNTIKHL